MSINNEMMAVSSIKKKIYFVIFQLLSGGRQTKSDNYLRNSNMYWLYNAAFLEAQCIPTFIAVVGMGKDGRKLIGLWGYLNRKLSIIGVPVNVPWWTRSVTQMRDLMNVTRTCKVYPFWLTGESPPWLNWCSFVLEVHGYGKRGAYINWPIGLPE